MKKTTLIAAALAFSAHLYMPQESVYINKVFLPTTKKKTGALKQKRNKKRRKK